jgi:hypothetical protein
MDGANGLHRRTGASDQMKRPRLFALIALLFLPACELLQTREVRTSREETLALSLPAEKDSFQFAIFGDRTGGPVEGVEILRDAVTEANLLSPDLVMTVGDLVQGYNETPQWLEQMQEYRAVMANLEMPWYPVAGNHDVYWHGSEPPPGHHEANYEANFGPLWYWFPHNNAAFIVLYSDEGDYQQNKKGFKNAELTQMSERQLAWLEGALSDMAGYDQVFVFLHHPRWRDDLYQGSNWEAVHERLVAAGNVSAVFAGHTHRQRYDGVKDGIAYYNLAAVGGRMPMDVPGSGWLNHSLLVTVREKDFEVATIPVGSVLDPEDMTPAYLEDLDRARTIEIAQLADDLLLSRDGTASGVIRYRMENTATRPVEIVLSLEDDRGDWFTRPNESRIEIAPGGAEEIALDLARKADGFAGLFSIPRLAVQVNYLGEKRRVSFPARHRFAAVKWTPEHVGEIRKRQPMALALDGSGAGLWFAADAVDLGPESFTLEAYVRTDQAQATGVVIGDYDRSGYALLLAKGRPNFILGLPGGRIDLVTPEDTVLAPGSWHHIAGLFDSKEARLYLDGRLMGQAEVAPDNQPTRNELPLFIGGNVIWNGEIEFPFDGQIDELRISSIARYGRESFTPARRFEPDGDTALLLHLDGGKGRFVPDASFHGRHGIAIGDIGFVAP